MLKEQFVVFMGVCLVLARCSAAWKFSPTHERWQMNQTSADNEIGSRINGGQVVTQVVPYQISLQILRRGRWHHFCGGAIIGAQHVITAAHCLDRTNIKELRIVSGTLRWRQGGSSHQVVAKRVHPGFAFEPLIINDVAVLKVSPPFQLAKGSVAAIGFGSSERVGGRVAVRLTGWGSTAPTTTTGALPEQLYQLDYRTISNSECRRFGFRVTRNEVCTLAARGRGACVGDSGGPLVSLGEPQARLVGIVSYGTARCAQGRPDVYTRISSFVPFIERTMTELIP